MKVKMLGLLSFRKIKEDIDMSRNDMEDKLDTVIKRVSKIDING